MGLAARLIFMIIFLLLTANICFSQEVGTVTSSTGQVWMDRNLGAKRVATAHDDSAAYGDLYQWGRGNDGHEKRTSLTSTTPSASDTPGHGSFIDLSSDWRNPQNDNLWQGASGVNNPCPSGFRLPTITEWEDERATWSSNDQAGAFASHLKLVSAGARFGAVDYAGISGRYWSSSVDGPYAHVLYFDSSRARTSNSTRTGGCSVRCIKDAAVRTEEKPKARTVEKPKTKTEEISFNFCYRVAHSCKDMTSAQISEYERRNKWKIRYCEGVVTNVEEMIFSSDYWIYVDVNYNGEADFRARTKTTQAQARRISKNRKIKIEGEVVSIDKIFGHCVTTLTNTVIIK